jgi:uncharacterized protein
MVLEGVISNVANFGAFVDLGVHQDGLVHISSLTDKFVSDPREIVKAGDIVKVKVMEVDAARKRISLSMRLDETVTTKQEQNQQTNKPQPRSQNTTPKMAKPNPQRNTKPPAKKSENAAMGNAFADAFAKFKK